jgi:hypothetical protein
LLFIGSTPFIVPASIVLHSPTSPSVVPPPGHSVGRSVVARVSNIAVIAHVDHGKTTLVDALLKQTNVFRDAAQAAEAGTCVMDNQDQERYVDTITLRL